MTDRRPLRIGTRGSPLALWQADHVRDLLAARHPGRAFAVEAVKTTGDKVQDRPLAEVGGKGLFTKEIDAALEDGCVDLAVHCIKDVETWLPDGIEIAAVLPREDPRDALISRTGGGLDDLPEGAVLGTASLRRQAQVKARRPDLGVVVFRGNVQTRLRKLEDGEADATLLAISGLKRLGMEHVATEVLATDDFLPAVGQGALGIACRADDTAVRDLLAPLGDARAAAEVAAERAMLAALDGSCRTPIAGLAEHVDGGLRLRGLVAEPDGSRLWTGERRGVAADAEGLGRDLGAELRAQAGEDFFRRHAG